MYGLGFRDAFFEDNYPSCRGSSTSPKKFCDATGGLLPKAGEARAPLNMHMVWDVDSPMDKEISYGVFLEHRYNWLAMTEHYHEIQPVFWHSPNAGVNMDKGKPRYAEEVLPHMREPDLFDSLQAVTDFHAPLGQLDAATEYIQYEFAAFMRLKKAPHLK